MNDDSKALSMSIRAKVNNIARRLDIAPQAALQAYFAERFSYAKDIELKSVFFSVRKLLDLL